MCSRRRHNSTTQDDDEEVAGPHPTFFGLRLPTLVGSEQPPPSKSSNSSSAMHTGLILVRALLCGKKTEIFFDALNLGLHMVLKILDRFKIDPIFRHSDTILLLWISFWHLHFRALLWSAYFKLQQHKILFHSCSVKSRIQNVTLWKGLESVCNVIVMVVGWLRGNYYIVQRVQDPR